MNIKSVLLLSGFFLATQSAYARGLADEIQACRTKTNNVERLVCYDELAQRVSVKSSKVKAGIVSQPKPQPDTVVESPLVALDSKEDIKEFGREHKRSLDKEAQSITSTIVSIKETARGKKIVTLENGSRWQQSDSSRLKIKEGQKVLIKRGMVGAFFLKVDGLNRTMKVKRIN